MATNPTAQFTPKQIKEATNKAKLPFGLENIGKRIYDVGADVTGAVQKFTAEQDLAAMKRGQAINPNADYAKKQQQAQAVLNKIKLDSQQRDKDLALQSLKDQGKATLLSDDPKIKDNLKKSEEAYLASTSKSIKEQGDQALKGFRAELEKNGYSEDEIKTHLAEAKKQNELVNQNWVKSQLPQTAANIQSLDQDRTPSAEKLNSLRNDLQKSGLPQAQIDAAVKQASVNRLGSTNKFETGRIVNNIQNLTETDATQRARRQIQNDNSYLGETAIRTIAQPLATYGSELTGLLAAGADLATGNRFNLGQQNATARDNFNQKIGEAIGTGSDLGTIGQQFVGNALPYVANPETAFAKRLGTKAAMQVPKVIRPFVKLGVTEAATDAGTGLIQSVGDLVHEVQAGRLTPQEALTQAPMAVATNTAGDLFAPGVMKVGGKLVGKALNNISLPKLNQSQVEAPIVKAPEVPFAEKPIQETMPKEKGYPSYIGSKARTELKKQLTSAKTIKEIEPLLEQVSALRESKKFAPLKEAAGNKLEALKQKEITGREKAIDQSLGDRKVIAQEKLRQIQEGKVLGESADDVASELEQITQQQRERRLQKAATREGVDLETLKSEHQRQFVVPDVKEAKIPAQEKMAAKEELAKVYKDGLHSQLELAQSPARDAFESVGAKVPKDLEPGQTLGQYLEIKSQKTGKDELANFANSLAKRDIEDGNITQSLIKPEEAGRVSKALDLQAKKTAISDENAMNSMLKEQDFDLERLANAKTQEELIQISNELEAKHPEADDAFYSDVNAIMEARSSYLEQKPKQIETPKSQGLESRGLREKRLSSESTQGIPPEAIEQAKSPSSESSQSGQKALTGQEVKSFQEPLDSGSGKGSNTNIPTKEADLATPKNKVDAEVVASGSAFDTAKKLNIKGIKPTTKPEIIEKKVEQHFASENAARYLQAGKDSGLPQYGNVSEAAAKVFASRIHENLFLVDDRAWTFNGRGMPEAENVFVSGGLLKAGDNKYVHEFTPAGKELARETIINAKNGRVKQQALEAKKNNFETQRASNAPEPSQGAETGKTKTRKGFKTQQANEFIPDEVKNQEKFKESAKYEQKSMKKGVDLAEEKTKADLDKELSSVLAKDKWEAEDIASSRVLTKKLSEAGRYEEAASVLIRTQEELTKAGQIASFGKLFASQDPEVVEYIARRQMKNTWSEHQQLKVKEQTKAVMNEMKKLKEAYGKDFKKYILKSIDEDFGRVCG